MKKMIPVVTCMAMVLCLGLFGCGGNASSQEQTSSANTKTENLSYLSYTIPDNWEKVDSGDQSTNLYEMPNGGKLAVANIVLVDYPEDLDSWMDSLVGEFKEQSKAEVGSLTKGSQGEAVTYEGSVSNTGESGAQKGYTKYILSGHAAYWGLVMVPDGDFDSYDNTMKDVMNSMTLSTTSAPRGAGTQSSSSSTSSTSSSSSSTAAQPAVTVSQQNAIKKAKSYLNSGAFSHDGLIDQLQYNSFSVEDATYAADNCGADWNAQAKKKATSYLSSGAFSHDGLIEQLEFNGFTAEQAAYGADNCGGDWNAQAAKKAASYMNSGAFSRDGLIEQLEFNGFTEEQAIHGADSVGL